jgi:hypothetical protein
LRHLLDVAFGDTKNVTRGGGEMEAVGIDARPPEHRLGRSAPAMRLSSKLNNSYRQQTALLGRFVAADFDGLIF